MDTLVSQSPLPPGGETLQYGEFLQAFDVFGKSDGAVSKTKAACGWCLSSADGRVDYAGGKRLAVPTKDSNVAEFEGLVELLENAKRLGFKSVWAGIDSFEVIRHLQKRSKSYEGLVLRIEELVAGFERVCLQNIFRKDNDADELARQPLGLIR